MDLGAAFKWMLWDSVAIQHTMRHSLIWRIFWELSWNQVLTVLNVQATAVVIRGSKSRIKTSNVWRNISIWRKLLHVKSLATTIKLKMLTNGFFGIVKIMFTKQFANSLTNRNVIAQYMRPGQQFVGNIHMEINVDITTFWNLSAPIRMIRNLFLLHDYGELIVTDNLTWKQWIDKSKLS